MKDFRATLVFVFSITLITGFTQTLPPGPQVLTFFSDADDTEQPYGLYLPKNYDPEKKYPLVMMLHGAGSNHRLALRRVFGKSNTNGETDVEASRYFPEWKDVDYIVATPFARGTAGYQGIAEKDVYDVLADVKKRFSIDEDRTYLTGLSMGGGGTLWLATTRPDIWAAIAPVCPAPPKGTDELYGNTLNLPSHFFHGDKDPTVPVSVSRDWVKKLKELGAQAEYQEYPGVLHDSWVNAYKDEFIFEWFVKFRRNLFPERVHFSAQQYKYNKAYWVTLDKLTAGTVSTIDARFTGSNQLNITTIALEAFTLQLKGHPQFDTNKSLQLTIDGKKAKAPVGESLSFTMKDGKWISEKYTPAGHARQAGKEGPVSEAFSRRHIYVYGTADNPSESELKTRQDIAFQAANWSFYRGSFLGRIMFFPRVLADKDVRPSDLESCDLILFGTRETNRLINQYKNELPFHLINTSDQGLFYIYPVNGHYVAVSSGLPWWTGVREQNYRFHPSFVNVPDFKDYVLFKGAGKNIIADGFFDQNWKLTGTEIQKLKESGLEVKE